MFYKSSTELPLFMLLGSACASSVVTELRDNEQLFVLKTYLSEPMLWSLYWGNSWKGLSKLSVLFSLFFTPFRLTVLILLHLISSCIHLISSPDYFFYYRCYDLHPPSSFLSSSWLTRLWIWVMGRMGDFKGRTTRDNSHSVISTVSS